MSGPMITAFHVMPAAWLHLPDPDAFLVTVELVDERTRLWAVRRHGRCLNTAGGWDDELPAASRTTGWLRSHRFDWWQAMELAEAAVERITVNGRTAADVVRHNATIGCES